MLDPDARLRRLLRTDPPPSVLALDEAQREAFADLLDETFRRQTASLRDSFVASLKHIPFPVRGLVKRLLIG